VSPTRRGAPRAPAALWRLAPGAAALAVLAPLVPAARAGEHPYELDAQRAPRLVTHGSCLIRGAMIHTAAGPAFRGDVLVQDGDIAAVGTRVEAPDGVLILEAEGRHLAPGVVDCHSHMAIEGGVNEGTVSISAEVRIADTVDADDPAIYRALAGGVTTARLLHGSANAIGGQDEIIKLRWKRRADELRFPDAPQGIKFALGENPKRSNWGRREERFPNTRMGVEAIYYRAFSRAQEYRAAWQAYEKARAAGEDPVPPRRDLRLEALRAILDGGIQVHAHCYRADGILMLIAAAEHYGFRIATLQHVLEGYKVAKEMADAGVGGSTFSDWWAYKVEAYDAIPQNAALMDEAGVLTSVNSDSDEVIRHLYYEAAKSVRYAGMDPVRALCLVTLNPARQLGIDDRIGSIEVGKDADLVLLTDDPLSIYARVEWTMVDGEIEFERRDAFGLDGADLPVAALEEQPDPTAVPESGETIALVGGTIHPVTAPVIEGGTLLIRGGRIAALGTDVEIPAGARVIDVAGQHVHPGLIALNTAIGLREIGAVAATMDEAEIGGDQPDLRVSASVNAESAHIGVTLAGGVTRVQTAPQGGGPLRGQSAVLRLVGDTWEELLTLDRDMLHVGFPSTANDASPEDRRESRKKVRELARRFEEARTYGRLVDEAASGGPQGAKPPRFDPRLEALVPYARGERRVALHAQNAQTILDAVRFAREQKLDAVLFGAREGWKVVDVLAAEKLPVVVAPVIDLPTSPFDPYDAPYANAAVLYRAGVPIAIASNDDQNPRNLPFHAGFAAAFGLPREEALRAITYYPARILGLEDRLGSLAVGKIADVVVSSGDPLETTSAVTYVFVDGVQASLENRQTRFYDKYRERLQRLQAEDVGR
jgi:imidazolonepropionase-like amidohydrolase